MNIDNVIEDKFSVGDLVDDRYKVKELVSSKGGMSSIYRAEDVITGQLFAIKTVKSGGGSNDELLAFDREYDALNKLSHPNIISLIGAGKTKDGSPYLILPWLKDDLARRIASSGPMNWKDYYECFGRPILVALQYAHGRRISHRDMKPHNIMIGEGGMPYVIDFGIARCFDKPQIGPTLKFAGSQPYTPSELDDGFLPERRDIYSWAAITVSCLTGKIYHDLAELQAGLRALRVNEAPKAELEKALSIDRDARHETASMLMAAIDLFHLKAMGQSSPKWVIYLEWSPKSLGQVKAAHSNLTDLQINALIHDNFAHACAASIDDALGTPQITLVGTMAMLRCSLNQRFRDRFIVTHIDFESPALAQRRREEMVRLEHMSVVFGNPPYGSNGLQSVRSLTMFLQMGEDDLQRQSDERARFRWLDSWNTFLREKERYYKSKQMRMRAKSIKQDGDRFVATIIDEFTEDSVGESVVIQLSSGRPLIFSVEAVVADQLIMKLVLGAAHLVPQSGAAIESNTEAERQAISRQRNAIEEIRRDRAVSPKLLDIICDPSSAAPPEPAGIDRSTTTLSPDKLEILDATLGVRSIHAVKGPPGTGKTTLIAELISVYLRRNPNKRILLSSQTHVALDHVIAKLQENGLGDEIVRVTSTSANSAMKVQASVRSLTLDQKARKWGAVAEERARKFMERYAADLGVDSQEVEVAILGNLLVSSKRRLSQIDDDLLGLTEEESRIDADRERVLNETGIPDGDKVLLETTTLLDRRERLKTERDGISSRIARLEADLRTCSDYGTAIADADEIIANEWIEALNPIVKEGVKLKSLITLQLDWFDRLGDARCLHGAVLSESRVAAGTCIGLASTPAIYQQSYDLCIIDEASKATATETLVPMARSKSWVLVGDPEQLPPFFEDRSLTKVDGASSADLEKTMLSIMLEGLPETNKGQLRQQRRMVSGIGQLISEVFYHGELENVRLNDERNSNIANAFPKPVTWISTSSKNFREVPSGSSFANRGEVQIIMACLRRLSDALSRGRIGVKVAIISSYAAQVRALNEALEQDTSSRRNMDIEVNTVDAFQGRDADVCIYSVTRSNDHQQLGFQRERRRLNVALSRAKDALVIVGDDRFCRSVKGNNPFLKVLNHVSENPDFCVVERA